MIYTSGSTGVPKGAMVEQRGLLNHLLSKISDLQLSASDVIAQTAPQSFDISVWQFLAALMVGGRVHICADEEVRDPTLLAQVIGREGVTVLQIVPALLRAILERMPNELDRLRAEPTSLADLHRRGPCSRSLPQLAPALSGRATDQRLWPSGVLGHCSNTSPYGAVQHRSPRCRSAAPLPTHASMCWTPTCSPSPIGVVGELCVGGVGVGRGYLNDPEQTRRSFRSRPILPASRSAPVQDRRPGPLALPTGISSLLDASTIR